VDDRVHLLLRQERAIFALLRSGHHARERKCPGYESFTHESSPSTRPKRTLAQGRPSIPVKLYHPDRRHTRMTWVMVAVGGAAGSLARYGVAFSISRWVGNPVPIATALVNVV